MKRILIAVSAFLIALSVAGERPLEVYLKTGIMNSPVVLQQFNAYQADLQKIPQVAALPDPQLEVGINVPGMEVLAGKQISEVRLMQMLPWKGVLKNARDEMGLMAGMKFEGYRDAKLQLDYDIQKEWFRLYRVRQAITITRQTIELLKSVLRLSVVKVGTGGKIALPSMQNQSPVRVESAGSGGSGMNTMQSNVPTGAPMQTVSSMPAPAMSYDAESEGVVEIMNLQSDILEKENSLSVLSNEEKVVLSRFNTLLNRSKETPVPDMDSLTTEPLDSVLLVLKDSSFDRNPMLIMPQLEQQALAFRLKMQKQMSLPMFGVGLNYTVISKDPMQTSKMNGRDMIMPMLAVSLPVYRKKYKAMQAETRLLERTSVSKRDVAMNEIRTAYAEAVGQYRNAEQQLVLLDQQRMYIQKILRIKMRSFSTGRTDLSEIMNVYQRSYNYDLQYAEAVVSFNDAKAMILKLIAKKY